MRNLYFLYLLLIGFSFKVNAQKQTCKVIFLFKGSPNPVEMVSHGGLLEYNYSTGFFRFTLDLTTLSSGNPALDSVFLGMDNSNLIFEGQTNVNSLTFQGEEKLKEQDYPIEGTLTVNNISKSFTSRYIPLDQFKVYKEPRINFLFDLYPAQFSIGRLSNIKNLEVVVPEGYLNRL